jgi:hypothetical protein
MGTIVPQVGTFLRNYFDCWEEIFVGSCLQFPLYFIIGWKILLIMPLCGLLWRLGGVEGGVKWARWAVVPLLIVSSAYLSTHHWTIFLAAPFMVKLMPFSYGKSGWLYKWLKNDFLVRLICFGWYWLTFSIAYCF